MSDRVILLHGLARTPRSMARLAHALAAAGYETHNWGYPSRQHRFADLAAMIRGRLETFGGQNTTHFVGHSLGGLLLRSALQAPLPFPSGRLVLIGSPHRGAMVIDRLLARPATRWLPRAFGLPAIELGRDAAWLAQLGGAGAVAETGAIAGTRRFHPLNPSAWINRLHGAMEAGDGTVELDSALWPQASAGIAVDAAHSLLPGDPRVIAATVCFLQTGRFLDTGGFD